jgi:opacity protein-like surface antigen
MKKTLFIVACLILSTPVVAASSDQMRLWSPSRISVGAYGGYGNVSGAYKQDGQFTQGRFNMGISIADYKLLSVGTEIGVQSGNTMRLYPDNAFIAATGGLPVQTTLKPLLDLLVTAKYPIILTHPLFGILKAGIAYRQLVFDDRSSARDGLRKVNGELQAGIAFSLTSHATLTAFYQGIYSGSNAGLMINNVGDVTLSRIPTQQAGFLGLEYLI